MSAPQLNAVESLQAAAIAAPRLRGMRRNPRMHVGYAMAVRRTRLAEGKAP